MAFDQIKIPHERIAVLIGKHGDIKKKIEKDMHVKLDINDETVSLSGKSEDIYFARQIVHAIGRGFSPEHAFLLEKDNYALDIISLRDVCKNKNNLVRVRARIIGEKGRVKKEIERATDTHISVYGWSVGIIGPIETIHFAHYLIEKIIEGARLTSVLNEAARIRKQILIDRFSGRI